MTSIAFLPDVLKILRLANGLSQRELGERMKRKRTNISKHERRMAVTDWRTVENYAQALDVPAWLIIHLSELMVKGRNL